MTNAKLRTEKLRDGRGGFTLMEVLIVLAILAVIIGMVVPNLMKSREKANIDSAKIQVGLLDTPLDQYALDHDGDYPPAISTLMTDPGGDQKWKGPYLRGNKAPADPWGTPIQYQSPGQHHSDGRPDVWSMGKDKQSNTADDITNWSAQ